MAWYPDFLERMIILGTADPEIKGGRFHGIKRHPKYVHPMCPMCGTLSNWIPASKAMLAQMVYKFEGRLIV